MKGRTQKSVLGMISSAIYYFLYIVLGIINRKILVLTLGIEYQGANGLFSSVLNVLSIAELGIGTAIIYHLYKPLADNDTHRVKIILQFYRKCFNYIAAFMLIVGGLLAVRIDFFIGINTLNINLRIVYLLMLADVVASYAFAYKRAILYANQKNYIISNINSIFVLGYNAFQIGVLYIFHDYYLFLIVKVLFRLLENIILNALVNRLYPYLKGTDDDVLPEEILLDIKKKIKGLLFHKISTFVVNGTDNILISKFIGLFAVGVYSNYNYIIVSINGLIQQIFDASIGSIGNLLVTEHREKCYSVFKELNLFNIFITTVATSGVYSLSNLFVNLLFKDYVIDKVVLLVLCLNMLFTGQRRVFGSYKSAAGIQYEDRYVPVCEAVINLVTSIILVKQLGLIGVFLGTLISQICDFGYTFPKFIFKGIFNKNINEYVVYLLKIISYQIISILTFDYIVSIVFVNETMSTLLFGGVLCCFYQVVLFFVFWGRSDSFKNIINRITSVRR